MDFDRTNLPAVYDAGRGYSPEALNRWRAAISRAAVTTHPIDIAGVAERLDLHPYAPFFPKVGPMLRSTFASLALIERFFVDAGFELAFHDVVDSEVAACWSDYAERISLRADSILIQLDDHEFAEGLERLRANASAHPERQPVTEPTDLLAFEAV
jgi:hypothetical protein